MKTLDPNATTEIKSFRLSNGDTIQFTADYIDMVGMDHINEIIKRENEGSSRIPVYQAGQKIGTLPRNFSMELNESKNPVWYNFRTGDFVREGNCWIACRTLGPGDLEAVPGFVWDRS